jgi:histidine ammonia-lyase
VERLEVAPVTEDRSFTPDLERLHALIRSGRLLSE